MYSIMLYIPLKCHVRGEGTVERAILSPDASLS